MLVAKKERFDLSDLSQVKTQERTRVNRGKKLNTATKAGYCLIILVSVVLAFLVTARHAEIDAVGYQLLSLKKQQQMLVMENQALQTRVNQLKSLENIEYIAIYKLGMQKPESAEGVQFVPVEYSKAGSYDEARNTSGSGGNADDKETKPRQQKNALVQALVRIINS